MKKIAKLAVVLTALSLFFVGCQNAASTTDTETDIDVKTIKLATPKVTTVAYPGANYITWDRVESASSYIVIRNDGTKLSGTGTYYRVDTDLAENGKTYKYTVWALAAGETNGYTDYFIEHSTDISVKSKDDIYDYVQLKSSKKTVSVKAIVPPYGIYALDTCNYEKKCDKDYIVTADNIKVVKNGTNVYVSYPTKTYLTYSATLYRGNARVLFGRDSGVTGSTKSTQNGTVTAANMDFYSNDGTDYYVSPVLSAGDYYVGVNVTKTGYIPNEEIISTAKVTIDALDVNTATGDATVKYTDDAQTVARLSWTPAKKADGSVWGTENYTVYTYDSTTATYTKITDDTLTVKSSTGSSVTDTKYYIDYTVPSNEVKYTFYVVLSDGDLYESTFKSANLAAATKEYTTAGSISGAVSAIETDTVKNDITWSLTLNNIKQTVKAYRLVKDVDFITTSSAASLVRADFDETVESIEFKAVVTDTTGLKFVYTQSDADIGTYYMLVVFSEEGKLDQYKISAPVAVTENETTATVAFTANTYDSTVDGTTYGTTYLTAADNTLNDVLINFSVSVNTLTDDISNYTYDLYRATATEVTGYNTFKLQQSDEWTKVTTITPAENILTETYAYNTSTTKNYYGIYSDNDLADGYYAYKIVLTTPTGTVSSAIVYATINTKTETTAFTVKYIENVDADGKEINVDGKKLTTMFKVTLADTQTVTKIDTEANAKVTDTDAAKYVNKGWTYTLYRVAADEYVAYYIDPEASLTQVWTPVKAFTIASEDSGKTKAYIGTLTQEDDTVDAYVYVVIATKDGYTPVVVTPTACATKADYDAE